MHSVTISPTPIGSIHDNLIAMTESEICNAQVTIEHANKDELKL